MQPFDSANFSQKCTYAVVKWEKLKVSMPVRHPLADPRVAGVIARQYGLVTKEQLHEAGLSRRRIERLIDQGILIVRFRGVYAVGYERGILGPMKWPFCLPLVQGQSFLIGPRVLSGDSAIDRG